MALRTTEERTNSDACKMGPRMNPAILDDHLGRRFPARWHCAKFSERALGKANFALGLKLFQYVGESRLRIAVLFRRAYFCNWLPAIRDQQGLTVPDGSQVSSETVFEFTAADPLHVATSLNIVATKARCGLERELDSGKDAAGLGFQPGEIDAVDDGEG